MIITKRFNRYKVAFEKDTGFDANKKMELYIQYVNARMADKQFQALEQIWEQLKYIADLLSIIEKSYETKSGKLN